MHFTTLALLLLAPATSVLAMTTPHHPLAARAAPSGCVYKCPPADKWGGPLLTPEQNSKSVFPRCYYTYDPNVMRGDNYICEYSPDSGALVYESPEEEDDCLTVVTSCGNMNQKRGRRAGDPKTKLEKLMERRPASKTVERTEVMERRRKVMQGKRAAAGKA